MNWYALHCKSNYENRIREALTARSIEDFCPTCRQKSRFAKGGSIDRPVLAGYVFCRTSFEDLNHRVAVLSITGVVRILSADSEPVPIPDAEIDSLRTLIAAGAVLGPSEPASLHKGDLVRITSGILAGVEGRVSVLHGQGRVTILMPGMGREISGAVPLSWLRLVEPVGVKKAA